MQVIQDTRRGLIKAWIDGVDVDQNTIDQALEIANMPMVHPHVALMPDCHLGKGSTVGSVIPTQGAVLPAAVGVDIGCGMISHRFDFPAEELRPTVLAEIRAKIEQFIPAGRTNNGQAGDVGAWDLDTNPPSDLIVDAWDEMNADYCEVTADDRELGHPRAMLHLGTLGTGNHFIELETCEDGALWFTIHSGSRGPGARIGNVWMQRAKVLMEDFYIKLNNPDLSYLPQGTPEYDAYMRGLMWAQHYAWVNREMMMGLAVEAAEEVLGVLGDQTFEVHCHHNYARMENHFGKNMLVTRKGAISAREDELGIIPGSMGTKTFIVAGLGNKASLMSASHGAGRKMSRTQARRTFTTAEHETATLGVECNKTAEVLDETPGAYKDIDAVMAAQTDLVRVVHTLQPLLCVKGVGA